jgi:hypothetical protein
MSTCKADGHASPGFALYQLVYSSTRGGRGFTFPCDQAGMVELNLLSDRDRDRYLLARALVGRDFNAPVVLPRTPAT